ncbi:type II toxin-antitoxin system RelB/DinJ family antitoxin [Methylacidimicrobium tartarophylax]|uniref:Antitoxin DinJ n=1 Tax=Methylacidimicrobium tartarophylax TaxID=1041768 RepID=A0A5E6MIU0_9BACT|nr:type II toxin-antitoxin system RelB/DinJ family antitoxin [Methylacidimicrobium tartarophylax]VVM07864.1 Antitoxin DinJ [Methylacidimicrobium tartarophylax]
MSANQLVQARIDSATKEEAFAVLAAMGLPVSDAVRMLLKKVAQDKALPFEPLIPNATKNAAVLSAKPQFSPCCYPRSATRNMTPVSAICRWC